MNYEDMDIPSYYEKKEAEHQELIGCMGLFAIIELALIVLIITYKFVAWCLR